MTQTLHPSLMSNKDKFRGPLKQVVVRAAMTAVLGCVQFVTEVG